MQTLVLLALACSQTGTITALAGTGQKGFDGDQRPATAARLNGPFDVALDNAGNLYFSDTGNHAIRRVDAKSGIISTIAGTGKKGDMGDGGPARKAELNEPYGVELDKKGNIYFVDRLNYRIRRVDAESGVISTVAGTGRPGYSGDGGPAADAQFVEPNGIALRGDNLFIADVASQRVRVVDLKTGRISTFAGTGEKAHKGDGGPATAAALLGPRAVAIAPDGSVVICEREGNRIRRVDAKTGIITTIAGTGKKGYTGDGDLAKVATFNGPKEIDVDRDGNVFVVDTENHAIRRIDARSGKVTTVAGTGKQDNARDGLPATQSTLGRPHGVCVGPDGAIYIGDTLNHRIRVVR
jgi:streptogramin lyase